MKYTILSINEDRSEYKDRIRGRVKYDEIPNLAFNAYRSDPTAAMRARGLRVPPEHWHAKLGELGVWLSNYDAWIYSSVHDEELIVFEDDAIPTENFMGFMRHYFEALPDDWDFFSLWVPDDQLPDFFYDVTFNEMGLSTIHGHAAKSQFDIDPDGLIAKVYQGYGNVAHLYSPKGARKLVKLAERDGLYAPVDCWIMMQARRGEINGYAPHPDAICPVDYDWRAPTTVHNTERI